MPKRKNTVGDISIKQSKRLKEKRKNEAAKQNSSKKVVNIVDTKQAAKKRAKKQEKSKNKQKVLKTPVVQYLPLRDKDSTILNPEQCFVPETGNVINIRVDNELAEDPLATVKTEPSDIDMSSYNFVCNLTAHSESLQSQNSSQKNSSSAFKNGQVISKAMELQNCTKISVPVHSPVQKKIIKVKKILRPMITIKTPITTNAGLAENGFYFDPVKTTSQPIKFQTVPFTQTFKCKSCEKRFAYFSQLMIHEQLHRPDDPVIDKRKIHEKVLVKKIVNINKNPLDSGPTNPISFDKNVVDANVKLVKTNTYFKVQSSKVDAASKNNLLEKTCRFCGELLFNPSKRLVHEWTYHSKEMSQIKLEERVKIKKS